MERCTTLILARSVWHQAMSWISKPDRTHGLTKIKIPVLVIHGEGDVPLPVSQAISASAWQAGDRV
jgi:pimeloyl-ACP methyl ester carboxylesterase